MYLAKQFTFLAALASPILGAADSQTYINQARSAAQLLVDKYYDHSTGLLGGLWWNTAITYTEVADLQATSPGGTNPSLNDMFSTAFDNAYNAKDSNGNTIEGHTPNASNFLNDFYDDEAWWGLLWVAAYDLTGDNKYLQKAQAIWFDMSFGWASDSCGGLWWNKQHTQINAIVQELFIALSAHLANRVSDNADYIRWAEQTWNWFSNSGMINKNGGIVQDAYDISSCSVKSAQLTYTQGVIIGALLELNKVAPKPYYLTNATAIADATIAANRFRDPNGIFHEPVGNYDDNSAQFKGVFMRNLRLLHRQAPKQSYVDFATSNVDTMLQGVWEDGEFGPSWGSWSNGTHPSVGSQSSAMSALLAAGAMSMPNEGADVVTKRWQRRTWSKRF